MIRFLIDQFRNAPGPLKKPRVLIADLSEEVLDLAKQVIKGDSDSGSVYPCCGEETAATPAATAPEAKSEAGKEEVGNRSVETPKDSPAHTPAPAIDEKLKQALENPANQKKQMFKILAILFDARAKDAGIQSAKEISKYGNDVLGIHIKHENVRKVIRMKLEKYVNVHAQGVGNRTVYKYEISNDGIAYFESTFLN